MNDGHLIENGRAVIRDGHLARGTLDHLVHAFGSETRANRVRHRLRRDHVAAAHAVRLVFVFEAEARARGLRLGLRGGGGGHRGD